MRPRTSSASWWSSATSTRRERCSPSTRCSPTVVVSWSSNSWATSTRPFWRWPPDDSSMPKLRPSVARELGDSSDTVFDAGVYGLQMFAIRREQGRLAEVLPLMRMLSAREGDEQPVWRPGLTALYAELGMLDESRHELELLAPHDFAAVPRDSAWTACLTFLAEACVACGAQQYARTADARARPLRESQSDGGDDHLLRACRSPPRRPGAPPRLQRSCRRVLPCCD